MSYLHSFLVMRSCCLNLTMVVLNLAQPIPKCSLGGWLLEMMKEITKKEITKRTDITAAGGRTCGMQQTELNKLGQIKSELYELYDWLNKKRDIETAAKLIPIVERLTHLGVGVPTIKGVSAALAQYRLGRCRDDSSWSKPRSHRRHWAPRARSCQRKVKTRSPRSTRHRAYLAVACRSTTGH